ncbi:MAG: hypothetical protein ABWZ99_17305, partial [Ilumatobacteraceae bacterium]
GGGTVSHFCGAHRPPRAGLDPVDAAPAALAVVRLAMQRPLAAETIALVLDEDHCGRSVVVVDGTVEPDSVLDVVERLAESIAASGHAGALVVASVRPGCGPLADDADRWLEASELAEAVGVELLEWFVIGGSITSPRDLLGEPPRWTGSGSG